MLMNMNPLTVSQPLSAFTETPLQESERIKKKMKADLEEVMNKSKASSSSSSSNSANANTVSKE